MTSPTEVDSPQSSPCPQADLPQKEIQQKVIALAWPAVTEQLLITLFGMVDMMMVGRVGPMAIAAVGLTNQPIMLALAVFQALTVGTTTLISRFIGGRQLKEANATVRQSLILVAFLGVLVSVLVFVFARPLVIFMGATEGALHYATTYLQVISLGLLPQAIEMSVAAVLRGSGDTRTPLKFSLIANAFNMVGNYLLIGGRLGFPALGVLGAGLSTTLSRLIGCGLALYIIFSGKALLHISLKDDFKPRPDLISRLFRVGLPAMVEQFLMRFGNIVFTKAVSGLGMVTYAAHQIGMDVQNLSFTPGYGFGMAATSLVGRSLGQERPDKAECYGWETRRVGQYVALVMALVFFFAGKPIACLFTRDIDVINTTAMVLKVSAFILPFQSTQFVLGGALRGAGDMRWPLLATLIGVLGIRGFLALFFIRIMNLGVLGAWYALFIDQLTRSTIVYLRFKSNHWQRKKV